MEKMKPIFMESWWMDAVCAGKQWQEILPNMPCLIRKKWWMQWISMPQMSQIGGMWVNEKTCTVEEVKQHAKAIDAKLREMKLDYYYQQYPIGSPLPAELKLLGYKVRERVTYRLEDLSDLNKVIDGFSRDKKRQLQRALSLHVDMNMTIEQFYQFHAQCLAAQHKRISYSREFLMVLYRKALRAGQCQIVCIKNADDRVLAASFVVWDKTNLYFLTQCHDAAMRACHANELLVLECIKLAREKKCNFDFEGSMIRGVATYFKQFGATPVTYYSVEKLYRWPFALALLINWFRNLKYGV